MPSRRRLAYLAASIIAAAGMMSGHWLAAAARAAGEESSLAPVLGIASWVAAGVVAVLIDRTVPAVWAGVASLVLPVLWFAAVVVTEGNSLWLLGLAALVVFALVTALSAAVTRALFRAVSARRMM